MRPSADATNRATFSRLGRIIQVGWIAGFLVGTITHVLDLADGGVDTYGEFPPALRVFWISLTLLDPLAALLVVLKRRAGIALGLAIIVSDIAVNWTVFFTIGGHSLFGVVTQSSFAVFLLSTAVPLWRWMSNGRPALPGSVK